MSEMNQAELQSALLAVIDPVTGKTLSELGADVKVSQQGETVAVNVVMGYPINGVEQDLVSAVLAALSSVSTAFNYEIAIGWNLDNQPTQQVIPGVKHIIAVASGKGGVGKSTTAVNLALALQAEGARVGLLDADIYGPSVPQMLGVGMQRPQMADEKSMRPITGLGVQSMSMGYLVTEKTPVVWRGPMAGGALQQILGQTVWDDVDYLIIDMPPGTGDIQLTLSQKAPVSGAVIVTTPQDIALLDAKKGIEMFQKVKIPVLGVVENMAVHVCSQCGHEEHIFGQGGGARIADDYGVECLGALPLSLSIRGDADSGKPSVAANPQSQESLMYREIARKVAASVWLQSQSQAGAPVITITDT